MGNDNNFIGGGAENSITGGSHNAILGGRGNRIGPETPRNDERKYIQGNVISDPPSGVGVHVTPSAGPTTVSHNVIINGGVQVGGNVAAQDYSERPKNLKAETPKAWHESWQGKIVITLISGIILAVIFSALKYFGINLK